MPKSKSIPQYPKSYYQFRAIREFWKRSNDPFKETMIKMLTESMNEVVEIYELEQDALKEIA